MGFRDDALPIADGFGLHPRRERHLIGDVERIVTRNFDPVVVACFEVVDTADFAVLSAGGYVDDCAVVVVRRGVDGITAGFVEVLDHLVVRVPDACRVLLVRRR